jgi:hypoxanthine phosphoribosyltransferase
MRLSERMRNVYEKATCIYTKQDIESALDVMAQKMSAKLKDSDPIFLCVLLGGVVPLGNLLPRLDFQMEINYIHVSSYSGKTTNSELKWRAEPTVSLTGRTVVIVDDILDSGITLKAAKEYCNAKGAKEVYTAVLLDKIKPRKPGGLHAADFVALTVEDKFVFGYGLDLDEYLRNAPGIYVINEGI